MPNLISKSVQTQGNWYTSHLQQESFLSSGAVEMSTSFWRWLRSFLIWSLSLTLETGPRSPPISLRCLSFPSVKWYENLPYTCTCIMVNLLWAQRSETLAAHKRLKLTCTYAGIQCIDTSKSIECIRQSETCIYLYLFLSHVNRSLCR